jgi:hypothetical protein
VTVTVPATARDGNLVAASLAWGDGTEDDNALFGPTNSYDATFSHTYASTGFYRIAASAVDATGTITSRSADCPMAVYDASDSAKGSGWVSSPAGAFKQDAAVAGKATFGEWTAAWRGWLHGCMGCTVPPVPACCGLPNPSTARMSPQNLTTHARAAVRAKYGKGDSQPTGVVKFKLPDGGS